jgi:heme-degrading monooxygenase HmoA
MFIAMNRFQVTPGGEAEFERIWRERESHLQEVPGFVQFALLRGVDGEYVSHSTWRDRDAFTAWTESEQFRMGHRQGGSMASILAGPPTLRTYEAAIVETPAGRTIGS